MIMDIYCEDAQLNQLQAGSIWKYFSSCSVQKMKCQRDMIISNKVNI